jgi:hypothetical protein
LLDSLRSSLGHRLEITGRTGRHASVCHVEWDLRSRCGATGGADQALAGAALVFLCGQSGQSGETGIYSGVWQPQYRTDAGGGPKAAGRGYVRQTAAPSGTSARSYSRL